MQRPSSLQARYPKHAGSGGLNWALQAGEFTRNAAATEAVFRGTADDVAPEHQFPSLAVLPGGAELSWADFREAVAWVRAHCTLAQYPISHEPRKPFYSETLRPSACEVSAESKALSHPPHIEKHTSLLASKMLNQRS